MRTAGLIWRFAICGAAGLALVVLIGPRATAGVGGAAGLQSAPAASAPAPQLTGSSMCRECHTSFYQKWVTSHHGLAMQPFAAALAAGQLKPQRDPIAVRDRRYRVEFGNGQGWVVESRGDGETRYAMTHALGGKNVFYFLTPLERGRLQVLPLAYDVRRQEWLDTTASAARGIMSLQDEVLDWRAPQLTFNTSCYGCHVSQFSSNYDPQTDTYHSSWTEPGINCETCHAAGGEHVRLFRGLSAGEKPEDIRIISIRKLSIEQINALCAACHAKAAALTNSFRPGDRYFDNYDLAGLEQSDFYPDGRDLGENYTYTSWRMSPCAKSGKLSCLHCHTSSGRYRFTEDRNQACMPCHKDKVENAAAHTHHKADSEGSTCVTCHMPMTEFARMRRSDHSMRPPTPAATIAFKSPNACNLCHADKDAAWSDKCVREWHSTDYQAPVLRQARLIDAARKDDWSKLPEILAYLVSTDRDEVFANALVRLLRNCDDDRKWPALLAALKDPSPLIRSSAAEALTGHISPETVNALSAATRDEYRLVRVRAAASLAGVPVEMLTEADRRDLEKATAEFLQSMRARPDDHASQYNLGNFYMNRGELDRAIACFETAVKLQPESVPPLVNVSLAYNAAGRNDKAEQALRRALKLDPNNAAANLNLGMLLGELARPDEAESAFRAAFKADPRSAAAAYNLGILLAEKRPDEAIDWSRKAAELRPQDSKYAYTYAFYLRQRGDTNRAIEVLRTTVREGSTRPEPYALLGQIYEELGRHDEAISVYRQALGMQNLPDAMRYRFEMRLQLLKAQ